MDWFPDQGWEDLMRLITIARPAGPDGGPPPPSPLAGLADDIERHEDKWRQYYDLECPEEAPLPRGYSDKLNVRGWLGF